jgi:Fe2+ or Zn2+ uptake regulation protein
VCGRIDDVHADFLRVTVPPGEDAMGFEVTATEIVFRGRCADCASSATPFPPTQHRR